MAVPPEVVAPLPEPQLRGDIEGAMVKLVDALTKWQPKMTTKGVVYPQPETLLIKGGNYEEALAAMNMTYLKNRWSDGLPLTPPTVERVKWLLTGTDLSPDQLIGKIPTAAGFLTVRQLAVNAAMAGARPEYMPVLIATFEAMLQPGFFLQGLVTTGAPVAPLVIVNGPIAQQIRVNSGNGVLGPDPTHPAGASIGRAIRLVIQNVGGVLPGVTSQSTQGQPGRYTGLVIAENEDNNPWPLLNETQGFKKGANVVTVYGVAGTQDIYSSVPAEWALTIAVPFKSYFSQQGLAAPPYATAGALLLGQGIVQTLAKQGWTKDKLQSYLYENATIPVATQEKLKDSFASEMPPPWAKEWPGKEPLPIAYGPKGFLIVVSGGTLNRSAWLPISGGGGKVPTSVQIGLPKNWDSLLKKAEEDLGPIPAF